MSDSIDRVFVKAITTIRALSSRTNYGSLPRPPAESRIKLYGLYKQATEGNVQGIMDRPEGYTMEDEGAKKKWDAWKREEGLSKTEAKRNYISYLIDTMRVYASGTTEARELLGELEYLWDQIKDVDFSDEEYPNRFEKYNVAPSVVSADRFSSGTPWPLHSSYSASVTNPQYKNNLEQIYSHSRRNTQYSVQDYAPRHPGAASVKSMGRAPENVASSIEDLRAWQGQINSIVNKLTRDFASRRSSGRPLSRSDSESEIVDRNEAIRRKVVKVLRTVAVTGLQALKNVGISMLALLFVVWLVKKNVVVQRTVVRKQLDGKKQKELVINMVVNTRENKWFVWLLTVLNSFVGFV